MKSDDDDEKTHRFVVALTSYTNGVQGIARKRKRYSNESLMPYTHQRKTAKRIGALDCQRLLLAHAPGTGKTLTALWGACTSYILNKGVPMRTLVVCPAAVVEQWQSSIYDHISRQRIFAVSKLADITTDVIERATYVIISHDLLRNVFLTFNSRVECNDRGKMIWATTPGCKTHPLYDAHFDMMIVDEAHVFRNLRATWTEACRVMSSNCKKVIGLSATPLLNRINDIVGLCYALSIQYYDDVNNWFIDKSMQKINTSTLRMFTEKMVDKVSEQVLNLPQLSHSFVDFSPSFDIQTSNAYNQLLAASKRLIKEKASLNILITNLNKMQQYVISPTLGANGACAMQQDDKMLEEAARHGSRALDVLYGIINDVHCRGGQRIIVACMHIVPMKIAARYLQLHGYSGKLFFFDGSICRKKRPHVISDFLVSPMSILFLSVGAGGVGLHICPGCSHMILFGNIPFSPMTLLQTMKRIHRIGQTKEVEILHVVAKGSVDDSIMHLHKIKQQMAHAIVDQDMDDDEVNNWSKYGTIAERCEFVNAKTGNFDARVDYDGTSPSLLSPRCAETLNPTRVAATTMAAYTDLFNQYYAMFFKMYSDATLRETKLGHDNTAI
jgi:SNF2 family DNA or RNA helicase